MGKAMLSTTHRQAREKGTLTEEDMRRVTLWLDCASDEFGAYQDVNRQRTGQLVWPELDVDSENPQGVDTRDSIPTGVTQQATRTRSSILIKVQGRPVVLPASFAGEPITISILDLGGRLMCEVSVNAHPVTAELPDVIGRGVYIVCCRKGNTIVRKRVATVR